MKNLFTKCLAALLVAMLVLSPVALMEELEPAAIEPTGAVEKSVPAGEEANEAVEGEIAASDVDAVENEETFDFGEDKEENIEFAEDVQFTSDDAMEGLMNSSSIGENLSDSVLIDYVKTKYGVNGGDTLSDEGAALTSLDLTDCADADKITNIFGLSVLFPNLTELNLSGTGITYVRTETCGVNVKKLYMNNCPELSRAEFSKYGSLSEVEAKGCPKLSSFTCEGSSLTSLDFSGSPLMELTLTSSYPWVNNDIVNYFYWDSKTDLSYQVAYNNSATNVVPTPKRIQKVIAIDATNFPDPAFRSYLLQWYDYDGDGWFTNRDIDWMDSISLGTGGGCDEGDWKPGIGATSLKGIELFPNLEYLECSNNQLTSLDLSKNTKLNQLRCEDNPLTTLDISHCSKELLDHVDPKYYSLMDNNTHVMYFERIKDCGSDYNYVYLACNSNVQIIGGNPVPPYVAPAPAPAPQPAPAPAPVIAATKKNTKASITAAPGTVAKLNVGATTKPAKGFKSSNKKIATVDKNGNLKIKKAGKVKITFKVGKKTRTVTLTIKDPTIPKTVTLAPVNTAVKKGDSVTLIPSIPEGTKSTYAWKSSNKKVATVKNGVVTFRKAGKVTIICTAKRGKKKAKMTFNVAKQ